MLKTLGYAGAVAIVILSLIPSAARPHTGAGGGWEHFTAYLLVALCLGLAYRRMAAFVIVVLALAAGSIVLELLQNFVPGRTPEIDGVLSSTGGALAGIAIAIAGLAMLRVRRMP